MGTRLADLLTSYPFKYHGKDFPHPGTLRGAQLNMELGRLEGHSSKLNDLFIASGRGNERPTERVGRTDPLSLEYSAMENRRAQLLSEVQARAGPGYYSLPRGVGSKPTRTE